MQQQLAAVVNSLEDAQGRLRRLSDKVSEEAWSRHPKPDKWSAADCVEHLNITSRAYVPLLRDANTEARLLHAEPQTHYRKDALGWFMTMMIGPMRHMKYNVYSAIVIVARHQHRHIDQAEQASHVH